MSPFGLSEHMVYVFTFQGLVFDHRLSVQSVSLRVFWPESKAHDHSWLGKRKADICWVDWWFDFSEHVDEMSLTLFWDEETEFESLIWWQARERDWAAVCCLQTLYLIHSQAELWPRFLRFALRGAGAPRVPAWSPACGHWAPESPTCFPGRVVDPVWWGWGWVPRGLHVKWRSSFLTVKKI